MRSGLISGHDRLVEAIAREAARAGWVTTTEKSKLRDRSHAGSEHVADAFIDTGGDLHIASIGTRFPRAKHSQFLYDVHTKSVVHGNGHWSGERDRTTGEWKHNALEKAEHEKYLKHAEPYANLSLGFLAFAVSSFGVLGDDLLRFLWDLATLRARKDHPSPPPSSASADDDPERAYAAILGASRARHFAAATTRVGLVAFKAGVARITGSLYAPHLRPLRHPPLRREPSSADISLHDVRRRFS
jgi:hypothetical protein